MQNARDSRQATMMAWSGIQLKPCLLFLFLLVLQWCHAGDLQSPLSSIDPNGFDERAVLPGVFVMAFCVPWFEPCKTLHGELTVAADSLSKTSDVDIYEIDCSEHGKFCASLDVLSFPTIRLFEHGEWSRYRGRQKASPFVTHVLKKVMDPVVELDEQRLEVMRTLGLPLMVMNPSEEDDSLIDVLNSLATQELSQKFFVGVMSDASFDTKTPSVTVYNILDETTPKYDGPFDRKALLDFANLVSEPLVRQFDLSAMVSFMKSGLPIGMAYSSKEDERKSLADILAVVAMKYRHEINFATVDAIKNSFSLEPLGLSADQLPAFVIQTDDEVFKFSPGLPITADAIDNFIQRALYGHSVAYRTA